MVRWESGGLFQGHRSRQGMKALYSGVGWENVVPGNRSRGRGMKDRWGSVAPDHKAHRLGIVGWGGVRWENGELFKGTAPAGA